MAMPVAINAATAMATTTVVIMGATITAIIMGVITTMLIMIVTIDSPAKKWGGPAPPFFAKVMQDNADY